MDRLIKEKQAELPFITTTTFVAMVSWIINSLFLFVFSIPVSQHIAWNRGTNDLLYLLNNQNNVTKYFYVQVWGILK